MYNKYYLATTILVKEKRNKPFARFFFSIRIYSQKPGKKCHAKLRIQLLKVKENVKYYFHITFCSGNKILKVRNSFV